MDFILYILYFVLGYGALTIMLYALSVFIPSCAFYAVFAAAFASLTVCAIYGAIASIVLRVVGLGGLGQWTTARAFKWIMWCVTGVWFVVEDEGDWLNTTRPSVIIGNHQTEMDVLMLGHVFPKYTSVSAKKSLKWTPFLGQFMTLSKTVFIDRGNRESAMAAFHGAAKTMHTEKQNVYIFVEGTRSYSEKPMLLPFKKGAFHLAVEAQVPIIPAVVENYAHVLNMKRRTFRPGTIRIKILKPIETKGKTSEDVDELTKSTRDLMLEELENLSNERAIARTPSAKKEL